jgi:hypothetical protein
MRRYMNEEVGEDVFLDEDAKILSKLRKKQKKVGMDILNKPDVSQRDLDELFAEA